MSAMSTLTFVTCLSAVGLCALLPAQGGEPKPKDPAPVVVKPQTPPKNEAGFADAAIEAMDKFIAEQKIDKTGSAWKTRLPKPPKLEFVAEHDYFWLVETEAGPVKVRYFPDTAPMHVSSGIYLARLGFYDGLNFHRVIKGFMAQGGDPLGTGRGSPGYAFDGEFQGSRKHDKPGILSMANAGPGTDGSQFFLTFVPTPHLDGRHTIWGEVVEGQDTLKAIEAKGTVGDGKLAAPIKIVKSTILIAPKGGKPESAKPAQTKEGEGKQVEEKKVEEKKGS